MKRLTVIIIIILATTFYGCSWVSSFYIINRTSDKIILSYMLASRNENDHGYALEDRIEFNKLNSNQDVNDNDIIGDSFKQEYSKEVNNGVEKYTVIIDPNTAISGGSNLYTFSYYNTEMRRNIFKNVIEMKIIRVESKDTINLTPALLYNFSRKLGKLQIALVFE